MQNPGMVDAKWHSHSCHAACLDITLCRHHVLQKIQENKACVASGLLIQF